LAEVPITVKLMDLKQLEYFVAVVDLGGFSRAARLLGVAQPAISRQVRSLEVELRQNLLVRNGRGASPTEAARAPRSTGSKAPRSAMSSSGCRQRSPAS